MRYRVVGWDLAFHDCVLEPLDAGPRVTVSAVWGGARRLVRGDEVWLFCGAGEHHLVALVAPGVVLPTMHVHVPSPPEPQESPEPQEPSERPGPRTQVPGVLTRADVERRGHR